MSDNPFAADIQAIQKGGVDLQGLAALVALVHGKLHSATSKYPNLGGNGQIGKSFEANYYKSAADSEDFLKGVKDLLGEHGATTTGLGDIFGDTNEAATTQAGGHHGGRKG
jgi:hypothetical protein